MSVTARLCDAVRRCLLPPDAPFPGLVVAVSGGPDSIALARLAIAARGDEPAPLVLAHLNHQLRGAESDEDERFVLDFHQALVAAGTTHLDVAHERLDVAALARERKANVEAVARQERYRWLAGVAREYGVGLVATGHTADDQAETVLHHLIRGTGLQGLRGIASRRRLTPDVEVVRPLLSVTRAEILAFLREVGQEYRHDRSNDDLRYTRNRIRQELLPLLRDRYNPGIAQALTRLAAQAEEARVDVEARAADLLRRAELPRAGGLLVFDLDRLRQGSPALVREVCRLVWAREGWPMGRMGHEGWGRLAEVVFGETRAVDLPGYVRARRRGRVIQVGQEAHG